MSTENTTPEVVTPVVEAPKAKRGRPVIEGSKRQEKLANIAAIIEAGGEIKKGRPVDKASKRQERLDARAARAAAGLPVTVGRPKGSGKKVEAVEAVDVAVVEAPIEEAVVVE